MCNIRVMSMSGRELSHRLTPSFLGACRFLIPLQQRAALKIDQTSCASPGQHFFFLCVVQRVREEPEKPKAFLHPAAVEGKAPRKDSSSCESRRLQNSHGLHLCRTRAKLTARLHGRTGNTVCQPTQRLCCALFPPPCSLSYLINSRGHPELRS